MDLFTRTLAPADSDADLLAVLIDDPAKLPADLKREIEDKVTRLKEAVSKKDITAIKAGKEDLESRLEALYKAAEAAQQSAGAAGPMPGAPAEEEPSDGPRKAKGRVVDAEIVDDDK